jgi:anaphase-promoting complex subunit 4
MEGDGGAEEPRPAFTQLLDRALPAEWARAAAAPGAPPPPAAWCPTMDLLALAPPGGALSLHRLNWQRLWAHDPPAAVTALAWRPDGRQLAAGLADGSVLVLDAEDGAVAASAATAGGGEVTALAWAQAVAPPGGDALADRAPRLLAPPPPPGAPAPAAAPGPGFGAAVRRGAPGAWPAHPPALAVLAAATAAGRLALFTAGTFPLLEMDYSELLPTLAAASASADGAPPPPRVRRLALPPSLAEVAIIWEDAGRGLHLTAASLGPLAADPAAFAALGRAGVDAAADAAAALAAAAAANAEWAAGAAAVAGAAGALAGLLRDHGVDTGPVADLLLLVTMGEYSAAMEQWLTSAMGEPGLKKAARAADAALVAVATLAAERLAPALERLAFRLGELRGLAAAPRGRAALALRAGDLGDAERAALRALGLAERLRARAVAAAAAHRAFFSWLLTALRRFPEDTVDTLMGFPLSHVDAVQQFLHSEFQRSSVAALLDGRGWARPRGAGHPEPVYGGGAWDAQALRMGLERLLARGARDAAAPGAPAALEHDAAADAAADARRQLEFEVEALEARLGAAAAPRDAPGGGEAPEDEAAHAGGLLGLLEPLGGAVAAALAHAGRALRAGVLAAPRRTLRLAPGAAAAAPPPLVVAEFGPAGGLSLLVGLGPGGAAAPGVALLLLEPGAADAARAVALGGGARGGAAAAPPSGALVDAAWYKDGALAALVAPGGVGAAAELVLAPRAALPLAALPLGAAPDEALAALAAAAGGALALPAGAPRRRPLPHAHAAPPLAVSAPRGVAFALAGAARALLFDLEEDEEDEEEEEVEVMGGEEEEPVTP